MTIPFLSAIQAYGLVLLRELLGQPRSAGLLSDIAPELLSFSPGLRTRDDGILGDISAQWMLDLARGPVAGRTQWQLVDGSRVGILSSAEKSRAAAVRILATAGGKYGLKMIDPDNAEVIGYRAISIPQFVRISASLSAIEPSLTALDIPANRQEVVWSEILQIAKPICQHILRPGNLRLLWPDDPIPAQFGLHPIPGAGDDVLAPTQPTPFAGQQFYWIPAQVVLASPASVLCSITDDFANVLNALANQFTPLFNMATSQLRLMFPGLFASPDPEKAGAKLQSEPAWSFDGRFSSLDIGMVRLGFGALTFSGDPIDGSTQTDLDKVLDALAFKSDVSGMRNPRVDWSDPASVHYRDFIEMAARQVGVLTARAVLLVSGVPGEAGHVVSEDGDVVLSSLLAPSPHNPLTDILGLHRPELRAAGELSADLASQRTNAAKAGRRVLRKDRLPEPDKWCDLAALEGSGLRTERAMPGPMSRYDVLAGVVTEESLDFLDALLGPLPAAYGPYEFSAGDRDISVAAAAAPKYGGIEQPSNRPGDDLIALIQRDLHAIGIELGLPARAPGAAQAYDGLYGYRQFAAGNDKFNGAMGERPTVVSTARRPEIKRGYTEWAVREFQIASRYPNRVAEVMGARPHYVQRLRTIVPVQADNTIGDRLEDVAGVPLTWPPGHVGPRQIRAEVPNEAVNGRLSIANAHVLRRWRFRRLRAPVVMVAGSNENPLIAPSGEDLIENVDRTDELNSTEFRVYAYDQSGYFGANADAAVLGYFDKGPANANPHPQTDITVSNALGVIAPEPRDEFLSAYRVIASVGEVEASGHFDALNAWDSAIFSYPLFHLTLTLSKSPINEIARPGQMAGFIRWIQDPPADLLSAVFPDETKLPKPNYPIEYPNQAGIDVLRENLSRQMRNVYHGAFGYFGVGASRTNSAPLQGFVTVAGRLSGLAPGGAVDMEAVWPGSNPSGLRQQAFYQSYQEWFRAWPWFYRFAAALRQHQSLRTLLFTYHLDWAHRALAGVVNSIETEQGRAGYLRVAVRGVAGFTKSDVSQAVTARGRATEGNAIIQAVIAARENAARVAAASDTESNRNNLSSLIKLVGSTTDCINYRSAEAEVGALEAADRQDADIFCNVRNDLLRRFTGL
jgi:hypothetical protein